ncbi:hypothetical protein SPBRAN_2050 [uncultured Candidatus Thioglobus sp.]|nr:hypothetical protein SPBRAN_2050 [uncultured Candidatus Thioglobus sp.]
MDLKNSQLDKTCHSACASLFNPNAGVFIYAKVSKKVYNTASLA